MTGGVRDVRAVLEAVVFAEDDHIRPGDRVRAVELLRELNELGLDELFHLESSRMEPTSSTVRRTARWPCFCTRS